MKTFVHLRRLMIVGGDIVCFFAGFWIALAVRQFGIPSAEAFERHVPLFAITFLLWIIIGYINGLYDLLHFKNPRQFSKKFLQTASIALVIGVIFFYLVPSRSITPKTILLLTVIFGYGLASVWHVLASRILGIDRLQIRILFVGFTAEGEELFRLFHEQPQKGYQVAAVIDPDHHVQKEQLNRGIEFYTSLRAIRPALTNHEATLVVVAPHMQQREDAMRELYELLFWPVQIVDLTAFYESMTGRIPPSIFSEGWFLQHLKQTDKPMYGRLRDFIDYIAMIVLGILFIVTFPVIALAIRLNSKGPIFFKQKRIGLFGTEFTLIKYRSMYALSPDGSAERKGAEFAQKGDARVTGIGKILRKTRLDELPQVINLIRREMTLIGPRPERPQIADQLTEKMPYYPLRHVVRPGMLGWAVIHQNYTDTLEKTLQKLQYDLYYIKNRSLMLDLSIVLRTISIIARGSGQ